MNYKIKAPKKLIEVALPLKEINEACVREKSIRHGHPSTLHLWWARRPLAAARAVLFAQLVNDPGWDEELKIGYKRKADANRERERLFGIIRELVKWENTNNEQILNQAREEIRKSWKVTCELNKDHPDASELFNPAKLPAFHDPFAGGGSIPLEAQRLGLEAWASDLNPVAVLINKAMIEIPPHFVGRRPIGPIPEQEKQLDTGQYTWEGVTGLAEDVRRYGYWVREEAYKRIGHLYPPIEVTPEMVLERPDLIQYQGKKLTVIAYIWARTVKSPNPLYSHVDVPLASTFLLSDKKGKEAYIEPIIEGDKYKFKVRIGKPNNLATIKMGTKASGKTANFYCLFSKTPIDSNYIKSESIKNRIGSKLLAIITEGDNRRIYLSPDDINEITALNSEPEWKPEQEMNQDCRDLVSGRGYGYKYWSEIFTSRQLKALTTFSDIILIIYSQICRDSDEEKLINDEYSSAITVYISFALDKMADYSSSMTSWISNRDTMRSTFGRQAIAMVWDYAEINPFSDSTGNWIAMIDWVAKVICNLPALKCGFSLQANASSQQISEGKIISTDPPYYDNIAYADLSDFFYIWIRKIAKHQYPELFTTLAVPKTDEIVAIAYRHENKHTAENFFLDKMKEAMHQISTQANNSYPISIYYAFKQTENDDSGSSSTGWETFLEAVIQSGLAIVGTWPMSTERESRSIGIGTNALASSIILVCRKLETFASTTGRKDFLRELNMALPGALDSMINGSETSSPVAPVDLAQAAIGPGMAVYSKYKAILESDGSPMTVHTALILINKALDEYFKEREGDWDNDTRFCLQWFSEYGWKEGVYGEAEVLAKAKGLSVEGVRDSGVLIAGSGKVRLYRPSEYPSDWNPLKDGRTPVWEVLHQLIRAHQARGESAAAEIASAVPQLSATARQLAFLLYTLCERQGWAEDARPYNDLVTAWLSIEKQAQDKGIKDTQIQAEFEFET
jgi:putative DNA methylase